MKNWVDGNKIVLYENGDTYYPAVIAALDSAQKEILIEIYIYAADEIGVAIADALMRAVKRGVTTRIVFDGFGSIDLAPEFIEQLRTAGVQVLIFRPRSRLFKLGKLFLKRLHRKIVVIDGKLAFVGGINVHLDQTSQLGPNSRLDYAVSVEGPLVKSIHYTVERFSYWLGRAWFRSLPIKWLILPTPPEAGKTRAAFITRDNIFHRNRIEWHYFLAIRRARKSIVIANAYFLPGYFFRRQLILAAKRGVKVVLLLQGRPDFYFVSRATHAFYEEFLKAGICIYEYQEKLMHAKVAVIDDEWATVGSCNLDPFSLLLNLEANVMVWDKAFAEELKKRLDIAIQTGSRLISSDYLHRLPWHSRAINRFCLWVVRWLTVLGQ